MKDFVIDNISWYKSINLNQNLYIRFFVLTHFLQESGLTNKKLVNDINDVNDNFGISSNDLTEEGLLFMKNYYAKWVRSIDKGKSPEDTRFLVQCLKKHRGL